MLTGNPPFNFKKADLIKKAKLTQEVIYPAKLDLRIRDLLENLLHKDPDQRMSNFEYYKERLYDLGVDMNVIEKDRYQY